jgi:hypothetical protein
LADLDRLDRLRPVLAGASFCGSVPSPADPELAPDASPVGPDRAADASVPSGARSFLGAETASGGGPAADP